MFTFPSYHVISVKVGLQLNKTVCKRQSKAPKAPKTPHFSVVLSLGVRVDQARVASVTDNKSCLAYQTVFVYKLCTNYIL